MALLSDPEPEDTPKEKLLKQAIRNYKMILESEQAETASLRAIIRAVKSATAEFSDPEDDND